MRRTLLGLVGVLALVVLLCTGVACGGGGGSSSPEEACTHYCSCSFASAIPNCESTCVSGIQMSQNPSSCQDCTGSKSCDELANNACANACTY